jgi:hypothetical protein
LGKLRSNFDEGFHRWGEGEIFSAGAQHDPRKLTKSERSPDFLLFEALTGA